MTSIGGRATAESWPATHQDGVDPDEALAYFDSLPVVAPEDMRGR